ncbi:MAG: polyprenyl synthetase family protein [Treponema sp.]|nr:polyprenyl synthetase family protein [Treponema sp.]
MEHRYSEEYNQRLQKIEAVLDIWLPESPDAEWLEKVFGSLAGGSVAGGALVAPELAHSLIQSSRDLLKRGGKRWRPLLMLLAAETIAAERGAEAALPLTPLVEFCHTASLIHDDIEDNSSERRGKPAVHLLYGSDTAINAGAFLYFLPLVCLEAWHGGKDPGALPSVLKDRIWTAWAAHMRALHLGQAMDIAWHRDFNSLPGLDEYDRMCRLKTGCLARLAAVLGVLSAGLGQAFKQEALEAAAELFGDAAGQLGVGFQILDDVKNLDTGVPGKKRGDDIVEGKKSLPVLLYLHRYPEKRPFVAQCFSAARAGGTGAAEVEELIGVLAAAGILEEARERGLAYIRQSQEVFAAPQLGDISLFQEGKNMLASFVDLLI